MKQFWVLLGAPFLATLAMFFISGINSLFSDLSALRAWQWILVVALQLVAGVRALRYVKRLGWLGVWQGLFLLASLPHLVLTAWYAVLPFAPERGMTTQEGLFAHPELLAWLPLPILAILFGSLSLILLGEREEVPDVQKQRGHSSRGGLR